MRDRKRALVGPRAVVALLAAGAVSLLGEGSAEANAGPIFRTPSNNIWCFVSNGENDRFGGFSCFIRKTNGKGCVRGLEVGWDRDGNSRHKRPYVYCAVRDGRRAWPMTPPMLAYGISKRVHSPVGDTGVTCTSRTTGLTCTNLSGHGFTLSKAAVRFY